MAESFFESEFDLARREEMRWKYDRLNDELRAKGREDHERGYVDIGGFNVPYHLQGLVLEHGMHSDRACAISDLFESEDDFLRAESTADTRQRDARIDEVDARLARLDAEEVGRQQSGLFPQR